MQLQISSSSMTPIYEQIVLQIRSQILDSTLEPGRQLPSVRAVARDYHISALTVKKAYDQLESEGLVTTVHGKGTYVCAVQKAFLEEQQRREAEESFEKAISQARLTGMQDQQIIEMVTFLLEESK